MRQAKPRTAATVGQRVRLWSLKKQVSGFSKSDTGWAFVVHDLLKANNGDGLHIVSPGGARMQGATASVTRKQERLSVQKLLRESCMAQER